PCAFCFLLLPRPPYSTLFPYTPLFRSCLHLRRIAAGARDRRRREQPRRDRHLGGRRNADCDTARHLLHPVPFRARAARGARRSRGPARTLREARRCAGVAGVTRLRLALVAAPLLLAGCSLAPKAVLPAPPVPQSWPIGDAYLLQSEAALPLLSYKQVFTDPRLQALIEQALINNRDLRTAYANVAAARAQVRVTRSAQLPAI